MMVLIVSSPVPDSRTMTLASDKTENCRVKGEEIKLLQVCREDVLTSATSDVSSHSVFLRMRTQVLVTSSQLRSTRLWPGPWLCISASLRALTVSGSRERLQSEWPDTSQMEGAHPASPGADSSEGTEVVKLQT